MFSPQFSHYILHLIICEQSADVRPLEPSIAQIDIDILLHCTYFLHLDVAVVQSTGTKERGTASLTFDE